MKFTMKITCECGESVLIDLKRTTNSLVDGPVYEDYTSITDSLEDNPVFKGECAPEGVYVTCKTCKITHELST